MYLSSPPVNLTFPLHSLQRRDASMSGGGDGENAKQIYYWVLEQDRFADREVLVV